MRTEAFSPPTNLPIRSKEISQAMFKDQKTITPDTSKTALDAEHRSSLKPWEDRRLSPEERMESYKALVYEKLKGIQISFDRAGEANDIPTQKEIMNSAETKEWLDAGSSVAETSAEEFCKRIDGRIPELLGKNFLGAEAWRTQGIEVGWVPLIPMSITKELLESECPLHPGKKIKDTHLLVLIPQTVNGEPHSALTLAKLCATRKGSGESLIFETAKWAIEWKKQVWASEPQVHSEWVLLPKADPYPERVAEDKHFRGKSVRNQQQVRNIHYPEYREATMLEFMTAVLLYDLLHKERLLEKLDLRCQKSNYGGGRMCVGSQRTDGLRLDADSADDANYVLGCALARIL